jgi:hypothetical protein
VEQAQFSDGTINLGSLYALPVTSNDLTTLQHGIQFFTDLGAANNQADAISDLGATQTVFSYAQQLLAANLSLSQVAMADYALMTGGTDTTAHLGAISTQFLPAQQQNAITHGFDPVVYDAEAYGLAIAGIGNGNNAFATAYGGLSVSQFAAAFGAITGTSTAAITQFTNNWIAFFTANPAAHLGISAQLAAYGAATGDAIGVALEATNPTALSIQAQVQNALIDIAETGTSGGATYAAGVQIGSLPLHTPLQGETQLVGFTGTLTAHDFMTV